MTAGCKTYGHITFDTARPESLLGMCDDPECGSCRRLSAAIKAEADKFKLKPRMVDPIDFSKYSQGIDPHNDLPQATTHFHGYMTIDEIIESGKFDFLTIGEIKAMRAVAGRSEDENPEADFENMVKFLLDTGRLKIYQYAEILQLDTLKEKVDALNKMMLE